MRRTAAETWSGWPYPASHDCIATMGITGTDVTHRGGPARIQNLQPFRDI